MRTLFFGVLFTLLSTHVFGHLIPAPNAFAFEADYLYFFNSTGPINFAQKVSSVALAGGILLPTDKRYSNKQEWHSGFRLHGAYGFCDDWGAIHVRWTSVPRFKESRTVVGGPLSGTTITDLVVLAPLVPLGNTNVLYATLTDHYWFDSVDSYYELPFYHACGAIFALQAGFQYSHIRLKDELLYAATDSTVAAAVTTTFFYEFDIKRDAFGPELGIVMDYAIWKGLSVDVNAIGSLLTAEKRTKLFLDGSPLISDESTWILIPAVDLSAGINYLYPCSCFCLNFGVGYEFMTYFNALDRFHSLFVDDEFFHGAAAPIENRSEFFNFILHGLYVQAAILF
jgi:hypothetical protein